jgi:hypothetical protein
MVQRHHTPDRGGVVVKPLLPTREVAGSVPDIGMFP